MEQNVYLSIKKAITRNCIWESPSPAAN